MSASRLSDIGEFGLIDRIAQLAATHDAVVGIGDDAAVLEGPGDRYFLATVDMLVQDTHFRLAEISPEELGATALAVNISDIAAMGGEPRYALVSLASPHDADVDLIEHIFEGLTREAARCAVSLVGGNVTRTSGPLAIDVVLLGEVPRNELVLRRGAKPGDILAVTGTLGGRAAIRLSRDAGVANPRALPPPVARVAAGRALASEHLIHAMMDISDGLGGDLPHICSASGVGALVFERLLPIAPAAHELARMLGTSPEALALGGGEDYELLIALPNDSFNRARAAVGDANLTQIGKIVDASEGIVVEGADGKRRPLKEAGWRHF